MSFFKAIVDTKIRKKALLFCMIVACSVLALYLLIMRVQRDEKASIIHNEYYKIIDNLYDSDEFSEFRQRPENINKIADFYNNLVDNSAFETVSVFDQALEVRNFKGNKKYYYNSEEFMEAFPNASVNIKALQINKAAFEFYDLKTEHNCMMPWAEITYDSEYTPIVLGANYKNVYNIGDVLSGNFYGKEIQFQVTDFLGKDSNIDYQNTHKFNLDSYVILPYPEKLWHIDEKLDFESILYFAMINCRLMPKKSEKAVIEEIKNISDHSGFTEFSLVGEE